MSDEILMPVDKDHVLKEANLLVLRSIQDAVKRIDTNMETMRDQVQEVRERMIRVEMQDTRADVTALSARLEMANDKLSARIQILESDKLRVQGAAGLMGWLANHWQIVTYVAVAAYVIWRLKGQVL